MELVQIGVTFDNTGVDLRERLAFRANDLSCAYAGLLSISGVSEAIILSTCNRVEIYFVCSELSAVDSVAVFMGNFHNIPHEMYSRQLAVRHNEEVIDHIFAVAASIKSMVLGETQIQSQIKKAFEGAAASGATGPYTTTLFQSALRVGKRVRTETSISEHSLSVSHAAVSLLKQKLGKLQNKRIAVIGAGRMSVLALKALTKLGANDITVLNRHPEHAESLSETYSIKVQGLETLPASLAASDAVVTATSAPDCIISKDSFTNIDQRKPGSRLLIVDISVPRNVHANVHDIEGVELFNVDQLTTTINSNRKRRGAELLKVKNIIGSEVLKYNSWLKSLEVKPIIQELKSHATGICDKELQRAMSRLDGKLSGEDSEVLQDLTRRIVNKLLHTPIIRLREDADAEYQKGYAGTIREIFGLNSVHQS